MSIVHCSQELRYSVRVCVCMRNERKKNSRFRFCCYLLTKYYISQDPFCLSLIHINSMDWNNKIMFFFAFEKKCFIFFHFFYGIQFLPPKKKNMCDIQVEETFFSLSLRVSRITIIIRKRNSIWNTHKHTHILQQWNSGQ